MNKWGWVILLSCLAGLAMGYLGTLAKPVVGAEVWKWIGSIFVLPVVLLVAYWSRKLARGAPAIADKDKPVGPGA